MTPKLFQQCLNTVWFDACFWGQSHVAGLRCLEPGAVLQKVRPWSFQENPSYYYELRKVGDCLAALFYDRLVLNESESIILAPLGLNHF